MEKDVNVQKTELKAEDETMNPTGLADSVYEYVKLLRNKKSNLPLVGQMFRERLVPEFTLSEVAQHHDSQSCWIVISDKVYDVTDFLKEHPGGEEIIIENAGTDATVTFVSKGHTRLAESMLEKYYIGQLSRRS